MLCRVASILVRPRASPAQRPSVAGIALGRSGAIRASHSHHSIELAAARLNRSELYVPGSRGGLIPKAARSAADVIVLDLEDSVAPSQKDRARKNIIEALREVDFGNKTVAVRINASDTTFQRKDIAELIEQSGERLDMFVLPMVGNASDVYAVDMLTSQAERAVGRKTCIGFGIIIETALGLANVHEIAAASRRNESLHFGVGDYVTSIRSRTMKIGGPSPNYGVLTDIDGDKPRDFHWGDVWHYALARIVVAARAYGLRAIDGPFADIEDLDGYRAQCNRGAVLGCEGKWAIHPSQVSLANEVHSPSELEVKKAKRILEAMEKAQREGLGALSLDGRLIDIASIKQAEQIVEKHNVIAANV